MAFGNSLPPCPNWVPHPPTTPKSFSSLQLCITSCNHPHMWWWHLASSAMAHVIRLSFEQVYLAWGQRGNFFMEVGGLEGASEVGANEPPTELNHLERFWHAEVALAACTSAGDESCPASGLASREGVLVGVLGVGVKPVKAINPKGETSLKVSQSWWLEEPSTRGERIGGGTKKKKRILHESLRGGQTLLFTDTTWLIFQENGKNFLNRERIT